MDEGEAQEENHLEPAKPPQRMSMLRGERALTGRLRGEADIAGKEHDVWVVRGMAWRQHSQPLEEGAGTPAGAGLGGWSRKIRD